MLRFKYNKDGKCTFYTHTKEDPKRTVKMVLEELRKTEFINETSIHPIDDRLSQQEATKFLGISVTSLISWKKKKIVPYYQIGRAIFFSKKELLNLARKNAFIRKSRY